MNKSRHDFKYCTQGKENVVNIKRIDLSVKEIEVTVNKFAQKDRNKNMHSINDYRKAKEIKSCYNIIFKK